MFGSSSGAPYWHHATARSPSNTSAACARRSSTSRCLRARLSSALRVFSSFMVWNHVHQHPPHTPLCRSARAAKSSHVSGPSGLTVYVSTVCGASVTRRGYRRASRRERVGLREGVQNGRPEVRAELRDICIERGGGGHGEPHLAFPD